MRQIDAWRKLSHAIEGWFMDQAAATWDALLDFQRSQDRHGDLAEIGVFHGKSASLLALHRFEEERLILVEPWPKDSAREVLGRLVPPEKCIPLMRRSSDLVGSADSMRVTRRCRWIHIDGEHTGEAIAIDLALADLWLAHNGVICVDDFFNPQYPALTAAAFHYLEAHRYTLTLFLCGHNKAYLCRPTVAPRYLHFIASRLSTELRERGVSDVTIYKSTSPSDLNCFGIGPRLKGLDYLGPDDDPTVIRY